MSKLKELQQELNQRIMFIDGAMGTMIQKYKLNESDFRGERFKDYDKSDLKNNNDLLTLTQPQIIKEIHKQFLNAGADIIETNTFNANPFSMADYKMEDLVYELNFESAKIARVAINEVLSENNSRPRYVAGALGPTSQTATLSPDVNDPGFRKVSFDDLKFGDIEQLKGLIDGGIDIILIETVFDTLNCKAAIAAVSETLEVRNIELPVMISGTIVDKSGRTLSGQTVEAFYISVSHCPNLLSIGLNCALGSSQMRPHIHDLSNISDRFTSLYPNAGLPNEFGEYDETPEYMAEQIASYVTANYVNIVGGCCGTTPDHINAIYNKVKDLKPRIIA